MQSKELCVRNVGLCVVEWGRREGDDSNAPIRSVVVGLHMCLWEMGESPVLNRIEHCP